MEEAKYPCADYKPGDDDLQSFDFIRKFELGTIEYAELEDSVLSFFFKGTVMFICLEKVFIITIFFVFFLSPI